MVTSEDIEQLLEQEEKKAKERKEAAAKEKAKADKPDLIKDAKWPPAHLFLENPPFPRRLEKQLPERYPTEGEENDASRSRKSRGLAEDEEKRDRSEGGSADGSVRSRRRNRSRSPDDTRRDRDGRRSSRDRGHYRDRSDFRGDYYRSGPAPASTERSDEDRYYRPSAGRPRREDDRRPRSDRPRKDDPPPQSSDVDRYASGRDARDRRRTPPPPKKSKTPEPTDDERDRRTVFVQQLAARLRSKELEKFFTQVGDVVEAQIVKDRVSGRSKGVGYVEFRDEDSVERAIQLTGQKLLGIPIIVQLTEAEKNRQARNNEGSATQSNGIPFHRLYVGNIHFSITEDDLRNVFEPFGELEFVNLQKDDQQRSKGYGFVQFRDPAQAKEALEKMNGFEIAGRPIRVGLGNDKFTPESTQSLLQRFGSQAQQAGYQGSSFSGLGGRGAHAGGTSNFDRASGRDMDKAGGASALDDTDVAGVNFSNYSRDALMRKLARIDEPEEKIAPKGQPKKAAPVEQPAPSRCVLLKNMYNIAEETEPNWRQELEEDVKTECEDKYGHVVHLGLALDSNDGEIYIKFDRIQGGENAIRGLNGRYFGGRMITAQYVVDAVYNATFPKAANL